MLSIFSCACWPSVCLLWKMSIQVLCPFFNWVVWVFLILRCMSCLYILEIKPLSVASFANIFSQSVGCLFILFMVSFAMQNLLSFIRSHLFIFVFVSLVWGDWSKKRILLRPVSKSVYCLCFLLGVLWFTVLHLGF